MRLSSVFSLLSFLVTAMALVPLGVTVTPNEKQCFYTRAHREGARIRAAFTVMTGGQFDIDATLSRPDGTVIERVTKSEGEEWLFNAPMTGDYELCFYNEMSTVTEKLVQFEFEVDTIAFAAEPPKPAEDSTGEMERYIERIESRVSAVSHQIQYLKVRNARNQSTVQSTASRLRWYYVVELFAVCGLALFNVTIVKLFFESSRKNLV